jgi:hypothetical protein
MSAILTYFFEDARIAGVRAILEYSVTARCKTESWQIDPLRSSLGLPSFAEPPGEE